MGWRYMYIHVAPPIDVGVWPIATLLRTLYMYVWQHIEYYFIYMYVCMYMYVSYDGGGGLKYMRISEFM